MARVPFVAQDEVATIDSNLRTFAQQMRLTDPQVLVTATNLGASAAVIHGHDVDGESHPFVHFFTGQHVNLDSCVRRKERQGSREVMDKGRNRRRQTNKKKPTRRLKMSTIYRLLCDRCVTTSTSSARQRRWGLSQNT